MSFIDEMNEFEKINNIILPKVYKEFLLVHEDGYSNEETLLFDLELIKDENTIIKQDAPEYLQIGNESGSKVLIMKQDENAREIYVIGPAEICTDYFETENTILDEKIEDFEEWFKSGCPLECQKTSPPTINVKVILIKPPLNGAKDLITLKKIFNLEISIVELGKKLKALPFVLKENLHPYYAGRLIAEFNQPEILETQEEIKED